MNLKNNLTDSKNQHTATSTNSYLARDSFHNTKAKKSTKQPGILGNQKENKAAPEASTQILVEHGVPHSSAPIALVHCTGTNYQDCDGRNSSVNIASSTLMPIKFENNMACSQNHRLPQAPPPVGSTRSSYADHSRKIKFRHKFIPPIVYKHNLSFAEPSAVTERYARGSVFVATPSARNTGDVCARTYSEDSQRTISSTSSISKDFLANTKLASNEENSDPQNVSSTGRCGTLLTSGAGPSSAGQALIRNTSVVRSVSLSRSIGGSILSSKDSSPRGSRSKIDGKFHCLVPGCGKSFTRNYDRKKHNIVVHLGIKSYACPRKGCMAAFGHKGSLTKHIDFVHKKVKRFECQYCRYAFTERGDMNKHIHRKHRSEA